MGLEAAVQWWAELKTAMQEWVWLIQEWVWLKTLGSVVSRGNKEEVIP